MNGTVVVSVLWSKTIIQLTTITQLTTIMISYRQQNLWIFIYNEITDRKSCITSLARVICIFFFLKNRHLFMMRYIIYMLCPCYSGCVVLFQSIGCVSSQLYGKSIATNEDLSTSYQRAINFVNTRSETEIASGSMIIIIYIIYYCLLELKKPNLTNIFFIISCWCENAVFASVTRSKHTVCNIFIIHLASFELPFFLRDIPSRVSRWLIRERLVMKRTYPWEGNLCWRCCGS